MNLRYIICFLLCRSILAGLTNCTEYADFIAANGERDDVNRILVNAAGASFPNRLYQKAIFAYQFVNSSVVVSYTSTGSTGGKCRIQGYGVCSFSCDSDNSDHKPPYEIDFAGSDSLLKDEDYTRTSDLQMYPAVAGSVVPIYNLPGLNDTLNLTTDIVAKIFRKCEVNVTYTSESFTPCDGNSIRFWNDSRIKDVNDAVYHPILDGAGEITVVVREDGSGTTEIWKTSLAQFEQQFEDQIGTSSRNADKETLENTYNADVVKAARNAGVAARVQGTESSIGYSVLGEAIALGIDFADIKKSGDTLPIRASAESTSNAVIEKGLQFQDPVERFNADISNALGSSAWPMVGYTYFVIRKDFRRPGATYQNRYATFEFLEWFYTAGELVESIAEDLGFSTLADNVRDFIVDKLREQMLDQGNAVYIPPPSNTISVEIALPVTYKPVFDLYKLSYTILRPNIELNEVVDEDFRDPVAYLNDQDAGVIFFLGNGESLNGAEFAQNIADQNNIFSVPYAAVGMGAIFSLCSAELQDCEDDIKAIDDNGIVLDYLTLADILDGNITFWNDSRIASLQPTEIAIKLPYAKIQVIAPSVDDALSRRFTQALQQVKPGFGLRAAPDILYESNTQRLRSLIAHTEFAIGYTTLAEAIEGNLVSYVHIKRNDGNIVVPSSATLKNCALDTYVPLLSTFNLSQSQRQDCYPLVEVINIASKLTYSEQENSNICKNGEGAGAQAAKFIGFLYQNVLDSDSSLSVESPLETQILGPILSVEDASSANKDTLVGISCDGVSILDPPQDKNLIPEPLIASIFIVVMMHIAMCLWLSRKVALNKHVKIIRNSSPLFLQEALVGSVIGMLALIPLSFQDDSGFLHFNDQNVLNIGCQLQPILYSIGFSILYSSIWLKTWRLNKVFNNYTLKKLQMENIRLQSYQLVFVMIVIIVNIVWAFVAPLKWVRVISRTDSDGNVLESYAYCTEDPDAPGSVFAFVTAFGIIFLCSLIYGLYLLYTIWFIPNEFNESKWIAFALITCVQSLLIATAAISVIGNEPTVRYCVFFFVILATMFSTIAFLLIPKLSGIKGMNNSIVDTHYKTGRGTVTKTMDVPSQQIDFRDLPKSEQGEFSYSNGSFV